MKKMLILLTLFCLVFCVIFTACSDISTQHTDADPTGESQTSSREETTESADTEETTETSSTEGTSSTEEVTETSATSATEETTESSSTRPYIIYYTEVCETKELMTEIPELQEKIDRNDKNQSSDLLYLLYHFQQKVILSIGDHRDVPYIFEQGGGILFQYGGLVYCYFGGDPNFSELERNAEYMPTYIYTGTENVVIELNDEVLSANPMRKFEVCPVDGSERNRSFDTFEEIYEELPKGKYYVTYLIEIYRNDIFTEYGEYVGKEHKCIAIAFMVELSEPM